MIDFGTTAAPRPSAGDDVIKDGTDATFMADVIDASMQVPVIVDFWAPWCGPCKTLGPALEAAVRDARGAVKLVKIDVDQNQQIAAQLRVQSIPTVFGFWQGQPWDAFQGALPPSQIKMFVDKLLKTAAENGGQPVGGGLDEAVDTAEEMLEQGALLDAVQIFAGVLGENPEHARAYAGLARAHVILGELDKAEGLLSTAPDAIFSSPELEAVRAQLDLARQAADAGPIADLRAAVEADPSNHEARYDLAVALHASGETEAAVDELLELFRRDREWNDGAAKTQLFKIFDALKAQDPIVLKGRRKLSSMIFA